MESIQKELQKCYSDQQLVKLIFEQISQIPPYYKAWVKSYQKYIAITVTLPSQTDKYHFKVHPNQIEFVIVLTRGYPFIAPRVHLKTCIISPGFDDCRNLIYDVLGTIQWDYRIFLKDVVIKIGEMLAKVDDYKSVYEIARFGQFCMNMVYPLELIRSLRGTDLYFAFESDPDNNLRMYIADISSTHLALFLTSQQPTIEKGSIKIPNEQDVSSCMVIFVAELGAISDVLINRDNYNDIEVNFACRKPQVTVNRKLKIRKGQGFIKKLIQNLNNYDLVEIKYEPEPDKLLGEEKGYLTEINEAEKQLQRKFNKQTIMKLNDAYQKAIEFYSSTNTPFYAIFVEKTAILLQRYDVKLILDTESKAETAKSANTDVREY